MANYQQWNMKIDEAIELAHSTIITILKENERPILLSKLVTLLNNKTKSVRFHQNKKLNHFSKYMKYNYGGIMKFLDDFNIYGIMKTNSDVNVLLIDKNNTLNIIQIPNDNEWVLV